MPRMPRMDLPLDITVDRAENAQPLATQIAAGVRKLITDGVLRPGDKLPAIRMMAGQLAVARTTVERAYGDLVAEGFAEAKLGAGTRVASMLPNIALKTEVASFSDTPAPTAISRSKITERALIFADSARNFRLQAAKPLALLTPTIDTVPGREWTKLAARESRAPWHHTGYIPSYGNERLRKAVADYARRMRGVICEPDQVIITSGTQQGLSLAARVLFNPEDTVWVEEPGYPLTRAALRGERLKVMGIPLDDEGFDLAEGLRIAPEARGVFVTPSHQCPMGMAMSMQRREALIDWAEKNEAWIVEDDYDSEMRYGTDPYPSLQGMDKNRDCVIYLGTFSKMIFPGLRLGYVIVPPAMVDAFAGARLIDDRQSPEFDQVIMAEFMEGGFYEAHIRKLRQIFEPRRQALIDALNRHLGEWGYVISGDQGMTVVFRFNEGINDGPIAEAIVKAGVEVRPLSFFSQEEIYYHGLVLGFTGYKEDAIEAAVTVIEKVMRQCVKA